MKDPILTLDDIIELTEACKLCEWINNPIDEYPCIICLKNPMMENYFRRCDEITMNEKYKKKSAKIYEVAVHLNKHYRDVTKDEYNEYWKNKEKDIM